MISTQFYLYPIQTICSMMEEGRFVVPSFRRAYTWSKTEVKQLLESIYKGYPIGTIVVLQEDADRLGVLFPEQSLFPVPKGGRYSNLWYVVDGAQRLAALYNSVYIANKAFNFQFDLETEEFHVNLKPDKAKRLVAMHSLYSPTEFSKVQSWAAALSLADAVSRLHDSFTSYTIPVQMLVNASPQDAASIYEVINLSGQRLSKAHSAARPV
ncbi:MAG TPA: DUF262 domain-containing protein [Anaerolineae bacterium]|nr:DUF262 domain-containing protein [Anaerolineae bacterium]